MARVIVLGSINVDLLVSVERLPLAGETVHGSGVERQLGGKGANQAVGAARAGASTVLLATAGADPEGDSLIARLAELGVGVGRVRRVAAPTGMAMIATSPQDNQIIVAPGANAHAGPELVAAQAIEPADVCLTQMETPLATAELFFRKARAAGARTVFNPSPATAAARALIPLADVLVVNETELHALSGIDAAAAGDDAALQRQAGALGLTGGQSLVVTFGSAGLATLAAGAVDRVAAHRVTVVDTTGAGDCFCGYLCAALARGDDLADGVREANAAAALSVQTRGAAGSIPDRISVSRYLEPAT